MATWTLDGGSMQEFEFVAKVRRGMRGALELSRAVEETLADLVAAYTPLLAPLIPATIGFENVRAGLGWQLPQALLYAVIVEFLGLATVTTALQFRAWNSESTPLPSAAPQIAAGERGDLGGRGRAPLWLAVLMAGFYLGVTLLVNVLLDSGTDLQKWVKAAASTFSIIGAITMALRNEQAKRVAQAQAEDVKAENEQALAEERARQERLDAEQRAEAAKIAAEEREYKRRVDEEERGRKFALKQLKLQAQVTESAPKVSESGVKVSKFPETFKRWDDWRKVPAEHRRRIAGMEIGQVLEQYGVEERVGYLWIERAVKFAQDEVAEVTE